MARLCFSSLDFDDDLDRTAQTSILGFGTTQLPETSTAFETDHILAGTPPPMG